MALLPSQSWLMFLHNLDPERTLIYDEKPAANRTNFSVNNVVETSAVAAISAMLCTPL
jgi:hypothetical protein